MALANDVMTNLIGSLFPGVGAFGRSEIPELALENFLGGTYIPPRVKALMRNFLPQLLVDYQLFGFKQLDTENGGGISEIPLFEEWLMGQNPLDILRRFQPQLPSTSPLQGIFARPEFGNRLGGGTRKRAF